MVRYNIPDNVDTENISAKYEKGILKLTLKKIRIEKPKMNKDRKQQILIYLFFIIASLTALVAYTIKGWYWGSTALVIGFVLVGIFTWIGINSDMDE